MEDNIKVHRQKNKDTINNRIKATKELLENMKINLGDGNETLDFTKVISQIGGQVMYIKSDMTTHIFKSIAEKGECTIDIIPHKTKEQYDGTEIKIAKMLNEIVMDKQTPHINLLIETFNTKIDTFTRLIEENVVDNDNKKYQKFITEHKNGEYYENVSVLISEWANRRDLLGFMIKHYNKFATLHWKVIFFQILSVIAIIQSRHPTFKHNNLNAKNILIHKTNKKNTNFIYTIEKLKYKIPNVGYEIRLWNFDFSCVSEINNKKLESKWAKTKNITCEPNRYYDIHYFFNSLIKSEFMKDNKIPIEVKDFINRIVPEKYCGLETEYVSEDGRILINDEYITANKILKDDLFFEEFRIKEESNQTYFGNAYNWVASWFS